jgi:hypothetical protein
VYSAEGKCSEYGARVKVLSLFLEYLGNEFEIDDPDNDIWGHKLVVSLVKV